jgi:hypothetical protein
MGWKSYHIIQPIHEIMKVEEDNIWQIWFQICGQWCKKDWISKFHVHANLQNLHQISKDIFGLISRIFRRMYFADSKIYVWYFDCVLSFSRVSVTQIIPILIFFLFYLVTQPSISITTVLLTTTRKLYAN